MKNHVLCNCEADKSHYTQRTYNQDCIAILSARRTVHFNKTLSDSITKANWVFLSAQKAEITIYIFIDQAREAIEASLF